MMKFAQWYVNHYCDVLGWAALLLGLFNYKQTTEGCILFAGAIILWGMQSVIEEIRKERTIKLEPTTVEKEDE